MLSEQEVKSLLENLESDRVERTESGSKTNKFSEAVCAFANDLPNHRQPGYLLIGAKNDGALSGLKVTDNLLQILAGIRAGGNIQPLPVIVVEKFEFTDGELVVVTVLPSDLPPVKHRGRVWVRVGSSRQIASEQEERILSERRTGQQVAFDAQSCQGSTLNDLVIGLFINSYLPQAVAPEIIEQNHRTVEHQLASLRFFDLSTGQPTHVGILLFGKDPLSWIPGAYVQFARFEGDSFDSATIAENALSGDLQTVLSKMDQILSLHNASRPVKVTTLRERHVSPYSGEAVREFLMNAVMHRRYEGSTAPIRFYWFSDHIEIQSPGGLFGESNPDNFPNQNAYRNRVVAEAMKTLGFVNSFGSGIDRAQRALARNGNPPAEFEIEPKTDYVLVKIKAAL
ncbi:MAG: putative DNA binding domain-containing protein [Gammaproteobacteria bacterium]|nr:putative DNA binding domain-containing protein [Gammaproteobacteria bacterium]